MQRICQVLTAAALAMGAPIAFGLERVPNTTLAMPQTPPGPSYKTQPALGTLTFSAPVAVRVPPGETNRLFVVEQTGRIMVLTNLAAPTKTVFLDLSKQILPGDLTGLMALAFHPGFQTNGYFFVGYNLKTQTAAGTGPHFRLSRFTVSPDDENQVLPGSEVPLITQFYGSGSGYCDDLLFGPDGYLYVAVADPKMDTSGTLQSIDADFFGGILRLDVDQRPGSLAPQAHPAISTNYRIPPDNPYVGATQFNGAPVDPAKLRTEFYAVGLRNPWRMFFDNLTGLLYVGDPGTTLHDEVNVVVKGGNYGWPYREGTGSGPKVKVTPPGFTSIDPIYQAPEGAIIVGLVCRGSHYPELEGALLFGDWLGGKVFALRAATTNAVPAQTLLTGVTGVAAYGLDPSTGEVLLANHDNGHILRLTSSAATGGTPLPPTLSDTGAFADLSTLTPAAGVVPYDVNVPFWSDNALKTRWFSVPSLAKTIGFSRDASWNFPVGTVWIKHFELELTNGVPESARRLETRLLVRTATGVYGATYRWGDSLTNALLVPTDGLDETFLIHDAGVVRTQVWHYPAQSECLRCHTPVAGHALGFSTAQLNRDFDYSTGPENQLRALSEAGYFSTNLTELYTLPALAAATNAAVSLDYRVHSYLAANCVQCHQPGGAALAHWDARLTTPLADAGIVDGLLANALADPANRVIKPGSLEQSVLLNRVAQLGADHMPPLATSVLNQTAIDLLSEWILHNATNFMSFGDWQISHFGSATAPEAAPSADPDSDGANNQMEFWAGTDPQTADRSWIIQLSLHDATLQIGLTRLANRASQVEWTTTPSDPGSWRALEVPGNEPVYSPSSMAVQIADSLPVLQSKFYRVRLLQP